MDEKGDVCSTVNWISTTRYAVRGGLSDGMCGLRQQLLAVTQGGFVVRELRDILGSGRRVGEVVGRLCGPAFLSVGCVETTTSHIYPQFS